jgi:hypothetical protein
MAYTGSSAGILSNYDEVLKLFYTDAIQEQLNHETILADMLEVNEDDISGKDAKIECHYGRSGGTGARADGGALPDADYQKYIMATVPMKYNYGTITFSGPTIAATRDARGAYANVIDSEVTGIVRDLKVDINRQMWGAGYGVLARWRSGTGTSHTLQKMYRGNATGGDGFGSTFGAKYLKENGKAVPVVLTVAASVITAATVATTNIAVSAIAESATYDTITCTDPSVTEAAGTFYVRPASLVTYDASNATGGARLEMMGLRGIVTDEDIDEINLTDRANSYTSPTTDTLQGLDADTYTWWRAVVDTHPSGRYLGTRSLTYSLMQKMFDKVEDNVGDGMGPNLILLPKPIRREYLELCVADRRYVNTNFFDGGWKGIEFNGVLMATDKDAIDGEVYFLTKEDLQVYRMSDYSWMEKDGAILSRISGYDAYEAVLFRYAELGCRRRNSHGVLCDIAYTA